MAVLNTNELVTISILQEIKIKLLTEKTSIQRNGRALEEQYLEDEPDKEDFLGDEPLIEGSMTFDQLIQQQLNAPTPIELLTHEAEKLVNQKSESKDEQQDGPIQMPEKSEKEAKPPKPARITRLNAWLAARAAWRIKKSQLEYEHDRTKTDVVNMCSGIDFAIKLIDDEIERQKSGKELKINTGNDYD